MRHYIGLKEYDLRRSQATEVVYDSDALLTGHMMVCGMSGTGKSFQSKRFLASAAASGAQIDIMDVHEEFHDLPGASACKYSQATGYGFNPLLIDLDPHVGGPNRQVDFLVSLVDDAGRLGTNQMSALRNLIMQTYAAHGILPDSPHTWRKKVITEDERTGLIAARRDAELGQFYPTLSDLILFAKKKVMALTVGMDNPTVTAFNQLIACRKKLNKANTAMGRKLDEAGIEKERVNIEKLGNEAVELFSASIASMTTGEEPEDVVRFESAALMNSLVQRLELLASSGIFRSNQPPFEKGTRTRVHQLAALTPEQCRMFVKLRLRSIWEYYKTLGPTKSGTEIRHILFIDEASRLFNADPSDILNVLMKESRKYGIALWLASQSPTEFPEAIMANVGATVIMGLHTMHWKKAAAMLRLDEVTLQAIRPKHIVSVRLQAQGVADPPFVNVVVPNAETEDGRLSAKRAAASAGLRAA